MSDAEAKRLANSEYWDERYAEVGSDGQVHEWFRSFSDLELFFARHLFQSRAPETGPRILHLGSGDSTIPQDLVRKGYKNQICVDFSSVVVETMSKRHTEIDGIAWMQADVRQMDQIPSGSINVAFDKGTLDAMIHGSPWDPPMMFAIILVDMSERCVQSTLLSTLCFYKKAVTLTVQVFRVLKPDSIFIYVTYRQPLFIKPLLNCEGVNWDLKMEVLGGSDNTFDYYGFVLKKGLLPGAVEESERVGEEGLK